MSNRIAITGVSRGLGKALTLGFAANSHTVFGCARNDKSIQALADQLGGTHQFQTVDVSVDSQVSSWAEAIVELAGPPDILINCAAIISRNAPLWELSGREFSDVVDVNINGTFHTIKHFVPAMQTRGSGVIVNFSSYWGRTTASDVAAYCATKWAIEGLSQALAQDLPDGLAAVALNPGVINTEMLQSCFGESAASYPGAQQWAESAVPYILGLNTSDNGASLTVPGF